MATKKSTKKAVRRQGKSRLTRGAAKDTKGPPNAASGEIRRRKQYSDEEKLRIVRDSAAMGFKPAAAVHGMAKDGSIRSWIRQPKFLEAFREAISQGVALGGRAPKLLARRYGVTQVGQLDPAFPMKPEPPSARNAAAGDEPSSAAPVADRPTALRRPAAAPSTPKAQDFAGMLRELADIEERRETLMRALGIPHR